MDLPDFLARDKDDEVRLTGHRLRLIDVAQRYQEGFSAEGIVDHYPSLNLPLVQPRAARRSRSPFAGHFLTLPEPIRDIYNFLVAAAYASDPAEWRDRFVFIP